MVFTNEEMARLQPYEQHFTTAIRSRYSRYPSQQGVQTIYEIYSSVVKGVPKLNASCSSCIFRLLVECGELYFKDKEELEKSQEVKPKRTRKK